MESDFRWHIIIIYTLKVNFYGFRFPLYVQNKFFRHDLPFMTQKKFCGEF